jgi:ATP-binding cassette subfamily B protein
MAKNFPFFHQLERLDCGATCLRMVARYYNRYYSLEFLRELTYMGKQGVSLLEISDAAEAIGMQTLAVRVSYERLIKDVPLPCIVHWEEDHFMVVYRANEQQVWIADPAEGKYQLSREEFLAGWGIEEENKEGVVLVLEPTPEFYHREGEDQDHSRWSYVWSYFKQHSNLLLQLGVGVLVAGLLQIATPFFLKSLVDIGIGHLEPGFISMMILGLFLLFVAQMVVEVFRRWILIHVGMRVNVNILSDFLLKLTRLPLRYFDNRLTGDLLQRIADHERIQRFLTSTTLFSLLSLFNFVAFSLLLFFWNYWVLSIFFIGTLLNLSWVYYFQVKQQEIDYKSYDQYAEHQGKLIELVDGMQDIKLHNAEKSKRWSWERTQAALIRTEIKGAVWSQFQRTGGDFINEGKNLLILFFVANAVLDGSMTIGMLVAIMYVVAQLNSPIRQFIEFMKTFQDAQISLERMNEIHAKANEEDASHKINMLPETGDLNLENVVFQYNGPNSPVVLNGINLNIQKGKTTVIVGTSGSGKSTLLKLLLNFYEPVEGTIRLGEVKLDNLQHKFWREKCGAVLQGAYIFNDTIARNIGLGDEVIDKRRLLKAVKVANIQSFIETLPLGYSTKVGKDGLGLSLGEQQRLLIARAVYKDPEYFFFDEATSALDAFSEMLIMENLNESFPDRTMLIVAHRLNTVRLADHIIVMESGEVVEQGNHDELYYRGGAYHQLVRNQIELGA